MLKMTALIFGIILLLVGILGFVPRFTPDGLLLGIFRVNDVHNWIHILTGVVSILCGISSEHASRLFFQIFGVIYGLVALLGLFYGNQHILGLVANNFADVILHILIAALALYLGFGYRQPNARNDRGDSDLTPPRDRG